MKKTITAYITICFIASLLSCQGSKQVRSDDSETAGNMTGEETGYAQIFDNDISLARDRAIDDAMNKLVRKVLGTSVSGRSVVEDFALVESIVEARSTGMVKDWKILKEGADSGSYIVTLRGTVYPQAVNDTIEATIKNYGRPKFMVLIKETFEGRSNMPGFTVTELTMMDIMSKQGFEFVDNAMTQQLMKREKSKMEQAAEGTVSGNVQEMLLNDLGAEVIITGIAVTSDQSGLPGGYNMKNMKSKQAIINIKAIDVYTGRVLASKSANAPGVHIDAETASKQAIKRCLASKEMLGKFDEDENRFISGDFINQITRKFLESATRRMIMITIYGLDFSDLTKFRDVLQGRIRGINKVYSRGQSGETSNIEVEFAGKTEDLAQELNAKADKTGFDISIKQTYPNKIVLNAKRLK